MVVIRKDATKPTVLVWLCSYNGEKYIEQQISSIFDQAGVVVRLAVSDDGSTDDTLKIVRYLSKVNDIEIISGPRKGFAQNFWSVFFHQISGYEYIAFSDQDDVWMPNKLADAIAKLEESGADLYGGRTKIFDDRTKKIVGLSPLNPKSEELTFQLSLIQSVASGNTMVFKADLHQKLQSLGRQPEYIVSHDWLLFAIVLGMGKNFVFDNSANILYRQHACNLIGSNISFTQRFRRLVSLFFGDHLRLVRHHFDALLTYKDLFEESTRKQFERAEGCWRNNLFVRYVLIFRSYRIGFIPTLLFMIVIFFRGW